MNGYSIFDERAGSWDTVPRMNLAKAVFEAIIARIDIHSSMNVLDFGAGTGLLSVSVSGMAGNVTAMDTSREMLAVLEGKLKERGITKVKTCYCDIFNDEHDSEAYDLVVSSMTLHHVQDVGFLFRRFFDVMKNGGIFAVADLDLEDGTFHSDNSEVYHYGFERGALFDLASAAGFRNIRHDIVHVMHKQRSDGTTGDYRIFLLSGEK